MPTFTFCGDPTLGPSLAMLPTTWATGSAFVAQPEPKKPTCAVTLAQAVKAVVEAKARAGFRPRYCHRSLEKPPRGVTSNAATLAGFREG